MKTWEECYKHYGFSANNYSNIDCPNCPYKDEDDDSCNIKRKNKHAVREYADWQRDWTNYNAN